MSMELARRFAYLRRVQESPLPDVIKGEKRTTICNRKTQPIDPFVLEDLSLFIIYLFRRR
jgi:hypothetical protein